MWSNWCGARFRSTVSVEEGGFLRVLLGGGLLVREDASRGAANPLADGITVAQEAIKMAVIENEYIIELLYRHGENETERSNKEISE